MKKKMYLIPALLFIICFISAAIIRPSFTNNDEEIKKYDFETSECSLNSVVQTYQTKDSGKIAENLIKDSDLIVKGIYKGNRTVTAKGFYTPVNVTQVLKGSNVKVGQEITLAEEELIFTYTKYINTMSKAYIPLQKGQEYILLLKKVEFNPARKLTSFENSQYYPITQSAVGAYKISKDKQTKIFNWSKKHESLNSLQGCELPVEDAKELDFYYNIKDKVFQSLQIL